MNKKLKKIQNLKKCLNVLSIGTVCALFVGSIASIMFSAIVPLCICMPSMFVVAVAGITISKKLNQKEEQIIQACTPAIIEPFGPEREDCVSQKQIDTNLENIFVVNNNELEK